MQQRNFCPMGYPARPSRILRAAVLRIGSVPEPAQDPLLPDGAPRGLCPAEQRQGLGPDAGVDLPPRMADGLYLRAIK